MVWSEILVIVSVTFPISLADSPRSFIKILTSLDCFTASEVICIAFSVFCTIWEIVADISSDAEATPFKFSEDWFIPSDTEAEFAFNSSAAAATVPAFSVEAEASDASPTDTSKRSELEAVRSLEPLTIEEITSFKFFVISIKESVRSPNSSLATTGFPVDEPVKLAVKSPFATSPTTSFKLSIGLVTFRIT